MVQYTHISRHDFVLQTRTRWYIDTITMVCYDYNRALKQRQIKLPLKIKSFRNGVKGVLQHKR